jgi:hypothetical protein
MPVPHISMYLTRRRLLTAGVALGAAGCRLKQTAPAPMSEENLIGASALSGLPLPPERVRAMKPVLEFNLKHLEILREFDPDEEEPLTMFRL